MYKPTLREDGLSGCPGPFESRGSFAYVAIGNNVECKRMYDEREKEEKQEACLMERQLPDNFTVKRKRNSIQGSFGNGKLLSIRSLPPIKEDVSAGCLHGS